MFMAAAEMLTLLLGFTKTKVLVRGDSYGK